MVTATSGRIILLYGLLPRDSSICPFTVEMMHGKWKHESIDSLQLFHKKIGREYENTVMFKGKWHEHEEMEKMEEAWILIHKKPTNSPSGLFSPQDQVISNSVRAKHLPYCSKEFRSSLAQVSGGKCWRFHPIFSGGEKSRKRYSIYGRNVRCRAVKTDPWNREVSQESLSQPTPGGSISTEQLETSPYWGVPWERIHGTGLFTYMRTITWIGKDTNPHGWYGEANLFWTFMISWNSV